MLDLRLILRKFNMEETLQERIEDLQYQIRKIDGHTPSWNIGNRMYGLLSLGVATVAYFASHKNPLMFLYAPFALDNLGDILTGKHHTVLFNITKAHPKYELEKLFAQSHTQSVDNGTAVPVIHKP